MVPTTQNVVPKDEWTSEKVLLVLASSVYGLCGLHSQSSVQRMSSLVQQPVFQLLTPLCMVCCVKVGFLVEFSKLFGVNMVCLVGRIRCDL